MSAMAMEAGPLPAAAATLADEGVQMAGDMAAMPCDHGQHRTGKSMPDMKCRPGMACYAALSELTGQPADFEPISYPFARLSLTSDTPLRSHPPDLSLRPPISL